MPPGRSPRWTSSVGACGCAHERTPALRRSRLAATAPRRRPRPCPPARPHAGGLLRTAPPAPGRSRLRRAAAPQATRLRGACSSRDGLAAGPPSSRPAGADSGPRTRASRPAPAQPSRAPHRRTGRTRRPRRRISAPNLRARRDRPASARRARRDAPTGALRYPRSSTRTRSMSCAAMSRIASSAGLVVANTAVREACGHGSRLQDGRRTGHLVLVVDHAGDDDLARRERRDRLRDGNERVKTFRSRREHAESREKRSASLTESSERSCVRIACSRPRSSAVGSMPNCSTRASRVFR